jgi:hypothetical protein
MVRTQWYIINSDKLCTSIQWQKSICIITLRFLPNNAWLTKWLFTIISNCLSSIFCFVLSFVIFPLCTHKSYCFLNVRVSVILSFTLLRNIQFKQIASKQFLWEFWSRQELLNKLHAFYLIILISIDCIYHVWIYIYMWYDWDKKMINVMIYFRSYTYIWWKVKKNIVWIKA